MWVGLPSRALVLGLPRLTPRPSGSPTPAPPGDGYVQADARGPRDYEDHLYVNTQGLDGPEPLQPEDSPKKDLFDMSKWGQASLLEEAGPRAARGLMGDALRPPLGTSPQVTGLGWGGVLPVVLPPRWDPPVS